MKDTPGGDRKSDAEEDLGTDYAEQAVARDAKRKRTDATHAELELMKGSVLVEDTKAKGELRS